MYKIALQEKITEVNPSFWDLNQNTYSKLFRTPTWLSENQWRLGGKSLFIEVYLNNIPLILFPIVLLPAKNVSSVIGSCELPQTTEHKKRVAACITLFGLGCPVLVRAPTIEWDSVISKLKDILRTQYDCETLIFSFHSSVDDPFLGHAFKEQVPRRQSYKSFGLFHAEKYGNLENYLKTLSQSSRYSFLNEKKMAQQNGLILQQNPIRHHNYELLGKLAANVFVKYKTTIDPKRLVALAKRLDEAYPNQSGVFSCWKDNILLAYLLYVQNSNTLYQILFGRNYAEDRYQSYFLVTYHMPMEYVFANKIQYIDYGAESEQLKKRRNIDIVASYSYIF